MLLVCEVIFMQPVFRVQGNWILYFLYESEIAAKASVFLSIYQEKVSKVYYIKARMIKQ